MATTERDLLDRLVNPEGVGGTAALLGASLTPGVSTAVDAASALNAIRNRDALGLGISALGLLPLVSGTTIRTGGEAAGKGIKSLLYHGSPDLFRGFELEKIVKPDSQWASGFGHYVTDHIERALEYARKNAQVRRAPTGDVEVIPKFAETGEELPVGYLYRVRLNEPESNFIRYNEQSLENQPEAYRQLYEEYIANKDDEVQSLFDLVSDFQGMRTLHGSTIPERSKQGFFNLIEDHISPTVATAPGSLERLLYEQYGIPGVVVEDALVRGKNFVAYDDDVLDILGVDAVLSGGLRSLPRQSTVVGRSGRARRIGNSYRPGITQREAEDAARLRGFRIRKNERGEFVVTQPGNPELEHIEETLEGAIKTMDFEANLIGN